MRDRISVSQFPSSDKTFPRYLNFGTCSLLISSIISLHIGCFILRTALRSILHLVISHLFSLSFSTLSSKSCSFLTVVCTSTSSSTSYILFRIRPALINLRLVSSFLANNNTIRREDISFSYAPFYFCVGTRVTVYLKQTILSKYVIKYLEELIQLSGSPLETWTTINAFKLYRLFVSPLMISYLQRNRQGYSTMGRPNLLYAIPRKFSVIFVRVSWKR